VENKAIIEAQKVLAEIKDRNDVDHVFDKQA
jgi:hypothetical protein